MSGPLRRGASVGAALIGPGLHAGAENAVISPTASPLRNERVTRRTAHAPAGQGAPAVADVLKMTETAAGTGNRVGAITSVVVPSVLTAVAFGVAVKTFANILAFLAKTPVDTAFAPALAGLRD